MNFIKIACYGAALTVPEFLAPLWPHDLPLDKWPTFLGAGQGWGDDIVPDTIHGVYLNPAGLCHDVEWACSEKNLSAFMGANGRFFLNCVALILASDLSTWAKIGALLRAGALYLTAVCTMGVLFFSWFSKNRNEDVDPFQNPTVKDRLHRLATARNKYYERPDERFQDREGGLYTDDEKGCCND